MGKVKVVPDSAGAIALMKSPEMQALLQERADAALQKLSGGYASSLYVGRTRANVSVYTDTRSAMRDNLKNNSILKALK